MNLETLKFKVNDKVAIVKLDRPPVNPLNSQLFRELVEVVRDIEANDDIRAVIITGEGEKAFAAGADISEMKDSDARSIEKMNQLSRRAFAEFEGLSKPTIAAINGLALGGGLELALCADFRICSEKAKVALPEITLAIIPGGGGTQRLQRLIGQSKAKELLYFGDMISSQEAYEIGLVNQVVEPEKLMETSLEWAFKLANNPPVAMAMMKKAVNAGAEVDMKTSLDIENLCFRNTFVTEDRKEGMNAFVEKRKPNFVGM